MKTLEEFYGCQDTACDHLQATEKWLNAVRKELIFRYGDNSDIFNLIDFLLTQVWKNALNANHPIKEVEKK